jgi:hypothetical protein
MDVTLFGLFASQLIGCGPATSTIPPGAQQVHVAIGESVIRLNPATVHVGDVYLVLDTRLATVLFVQQKDAADAIPGPLSEARLARLALGDTQGTSIEGFADPGCTEQQKTDAVGRLGYCSNVFMVAVSAGKYAFLTEDPSASGEGLQPPKAVAVLQVLP